MSFRSFPRAAVTALLLVVVSLASSAVLAQSRFCIDRDTIVFGDRPVGSTSSVSVTVTNCGSAPFSFTGVNLQAGGGFTAQSACVTGAVLAPGASCSATVTFAPLAAGQQSGALWLLNTTSTATQLVTFYGRGTTAAAGTATLGFTPSPLQFPDTVVGTPSAVLGLDLVNRGSAAITLSAVVFNGPAAYDFDGVGDCGTGRVIAVGSSCHMDLVFTPGGTGTRLANLNVDAPQLASLAILHIGGVGLAVPAPVATVDAVEFHDAGNDGYFLSTDPAEIDFLDRGGLAGAWVRTGRQFRALPLGNTDPAAADACRFFGTPGNGPDSHFYTVSVAECALVKNDPHWQYEGLAFRMVPVGPAGTCPAGMDVVQRLLKPAADVTGLRHRYVVAATDVAAMVTAGWLLEGPVFCAVH